MKWVRPIIYGSFAISFMMLATFFLLSDFSLSGFNRNVLLLVSAVMALIMAWAALISLKLKDSEATGKPSHSIAHYGKVIFASYGVAVGGVILLNVVGLFILGFEAVDEYLLENTWLVLLGITILALPVVSRYLR